MDKEKLYEVKNKYSDVTINRTEEEIDRMAREILETLNLNQKLGQMYQMVEGANPFGSKLVDRKLEKSIVNGDTGVILGTVDWEKALRFQQLAVEQSASGIPLLFNADIIHGCDTIYPIPLGFACSFDMEAVEKAARMAAVEATAIGVHWNNSPMIDVSRDPRWGRCTEGVGEDPYLGAQLAKAQIKGYQSYEHGANHYMMACAKHFVAYGAPEGGRDYNTVNISERELYEVYLPPFEAAVRESVDSIMPAFSTYNNIPVTAHKGLLQTLLREKLNFDGILISDYTAVAELINHGVAANEKEAAQLSLEAGLDVEMVSDCILEYGRELVSHGEISMERIDASVMRLLKAKIKLGLFDNPYRYINPAEYEKVTLSPQHKGIARDLARKSMVLLKNENHVLPLSEQQSAIALIGPFAKEKEIEGAWAFVKQRESMVSLSEGLLNRGVDTVFNEAVGCDLKETDEVKIKAMIDQAVLAAKQSDVVLLAIGEPQQMSGEAKSYGKIDLHSSQKRLTEELLKTGKPIVVILFNGRPVLLDWYQQHVQAILEVWFPGTEGGNGIADVLYGDYNPSGKLAMSFPYCEGQIPVHYRQLKTGRPLEENPEDPYRSKYEDIPNEPLYPFGFGLSYTHFEYSKVTLSKDSKKPGESIRASVMLTNSGSYQGTEVVQLYIRDIHAYGVSRPVKELKGFQKVSLKPGETQQVHFDITDDMLDYYSVQLKKILEPGQFEIFIGASSNTTNSKVFILNDPK